MSVVDFFGSRWHGLPILESVAFLGHVSEVRAEVLHFELLVVVSRVSGQRDVLLQHVLLIQTRKQNVREKAFKFNAMALDDLLANFEKRRWFTK